MKITSTTITTIIIESPPFGCLAGKEGVDLALVCAAFDQQVALIFVNQGVFHLIRHQDGNFFDDKLHDKQLAGLEYYDIDKCYVESESLTKYSIPENELIPKMTTLTTEEIRQHCNNSNHTVVF